ncbi:MAG: gliding motility protein [Promethearchaeota archaeon]|nr:MAG: gliding motility protein [Candidatus Lokiarchaeota archaeon]
MIIDHGKHILMFKIVWWGPAMSGKSTSVRYLFKKYNRLDSLSSIETGAGRTLFFDFGDLSFTKGNWNIKINIWTCTGQNFYSETRPTVLNGADGLVFVADAQNNLIQHNIESWEELKRLMGARITKIPIVFCLNKVDLNGSTNLLSIPELIKHLNLESGISIFKTVATKGQNVYESFTTLLNKIQSG